MNEWKLAELNEQLTSSQINAYGGAIMINNNIIKAVSKDWAIQPNCTSA